MEKKPNPLRIVILGLLGRNDAVSYTQVYDFDGLDERTAKEEGLSKDAWSILKDGTREAKTFEDTFNGKASKAQKSPAQIKPKVRTIQPAQNPSERIDRTSIVEGETKTADKGDDMGPERTIGPGH